MTDVTPDDQDRKETKPETPTDTVGKAGFKAASAAPETDTSSDPLAAQEKVDRAHADHLAEQSAETEAPVASAATATPSLPLSDEAAEEEKSTNHANQVLANAQCLHAIAALFEKDELLLKEYLSDMVLVAQTDNGLFLKGADNEFTLSKDIIQAEQETISAKAAFEMSILAFNNPAFDQQGIDLTGNLRDRYMLTLAADHFGLKVTNPVTEIPDALKAEFALVKAEWDSLVENPDALILAAPVDNIAEEPATASPVAGETSVETVADETPAPAEDAVAVLEAEEQVTSPVADESAIEAPAEEEAAPVAENAAPAAEAAPRDEHYDKAVELVVNAGKASKALLQRNLHVGFNRASRLVEEMEKQGVIGPADSAGKREVLVKPAAPAQPQP